jgi:hypothetical protein
MSGSGPSEHSQRDRETFRERSNHITAPKGENAPRSSQRTNSIWEDAKKPARLGITPTPKGRKIQVRCVLASKTTAFTVTMSGNAPLMPQSHKRLYRAQGDPATSTYPKKSASQGLFAQFYQKFENLEKKGLPPVALATTSQYSPEK